MGIYYRPDKLKDALEVMAKGTVRPVAGCTDVFAATEAQKLEGSVLDVTAISDLKGVQRTDTGWRIGAATSWTMLRDAELPESFDALKQAAAEIGGVQVQNAGTVAGNICNASPAADGMPPLLALDAEVELVSQSGLRHVPLAEFVLGPRQTVRRLNELVSAIEVPDSATGGVSRFLKLGARKHLVISIAMVAVRLKVSQGKIAEAAVSVGACGPVACRLPEVERVLVGQSMEGAGTCVTVDHVSAALAPISDVRAEAAYRCEVSKQLIARAIEELSGEMS